MVAAMSSSCLPRPGLARTVVVPMSLVADAHMLSLVAAGTSGVKKAVQKMNACTAPPTTPRFSLTLRCCLTDCECTAQLHTHISTACPQCASSQC